LPDWTVGGLSGHLASEISVLSLVLGTPVRDEPVITLTEHYARAAWVSADVDDEVNVAIRRSTDEAAAAGPEAVLRRTRADRGTVARELARRSADHVVVLPWQGWGLTLGDFLVTRMVELAVHSDDLAVSVGVEPPELPETVLTPVLALLTRVAVRRHGQAAVLRALTRHERAPRSISAF
jgi:hypothetical protein